MSNNNYNNILNEARTVNDQILSQEANGISDPLSVEKLKKIEKRLAVLESQKTANGNETIFGTTINNEYRDAFLQYIRKGDTAILSKLSSVGINLNDAGFTVAPSMEGLISAKVNELSVLRQISSVTQISSDSLDLVTENNGGKASWGEPSENTTVVKKYIKAYDVVAQPKATAKLLEDGAIDVESYIAERIADSFARAEDESFLIGDGNSKPRGILTLQHGETAETIEQIAGGLTFQSIMDLQSSLDTFYANSAAYIMHKNTESALRFLKDTSGNYIWRPSEKQGDVATILGIPVYTTNYMPYGAGKKSIVFGNFKMAYHIVERMGVNILRDPFTEKPFVKFYTLRRVGGDITDGRALKILVQS